MPKMNSDHKLLQCDEIYSRGVDVIKNSIRVIQEEIVPIKSFLHHRKKDISKKISEIQPSERVCTFDFVQMFYRYMLKEIVNIEEACERGLVKLNSDYVAATKDRMQPPSHVLPEELKKAQAMCYELFDETEDETLCHCTWENIPKWSLDDTQDILTKPRETLRTEFDETDLKFKQDIAYLRSKMFSLPRESKKPAENKHRSSTESLTKTTDFVRALKRKESLVPRSVEEELSKISSLKFVDGKFRSSDNWDKALDLHGWQHASKWHLLICPRIGKVARKRLIPELRLKTRATFNFISTFSGIANPTVEKEDLIDLLKYKKDAVWLTSWRMQMKMIDGEHVAATLIQALWRGYLLRKKRQLSSTIYVAASVIWYAWLTSKQKMVMHQCYLDKMLISLHITRELTLKLSNRFYTLIEEPHVIVHLPSFGYPQELRRILDPKMFSIFQNQTILRICMVRNPKTEAVYILPVKPTRDLLMMYSDFIESISPYENIAKRITFIALSQGETFKNRALNVSRILHCSEDTLREIRRKINGKSAYFLPGVIDECDMRVAGSLDVPLLSPDMELQRQLLNVSAMSEIIESLGLLQPPHVRNITDFDTLCESLAQSIAIHTEVCMWAIRLNYGSVTKHRAIFLINHISVPFMPILRKERQKHGDDWRTQPALREEFLGKLRARLPKIVPIVTELTSIYSSWRQFYLHVQKFGCMLQAIPMEKKARIAVVTLFIPGKDTNRKPRWLGTADKINFESKVSATAIYMLPESTLNIVDVEPTANRLAVGLQNRGYFGYMSINCYCYVDKSSENVVVWLLNIQPYYSFSHSYMDWMKFAIDGWYSDEVNKFVSEMKVHPKERVRTSDLLAHSPSTWNETVQRYGVVISHIHHSAIPTYRWSKLRNLLERCGIAFNRGTKEGSSFILHDGEVLTVGHMLTVASSMGTALSMVHSSLTKLYQALSSRRKKNIESNLPELIDFFAKLSIDYEHLEIDVCTPDI